MNYGAGLDGLFQMAAVFAVAALLAVPLALWGWLREPQGDIKQQAIERGYALYCPESGDWSWRGECAMEEEQ